MEALRGSASSSPLSLKFLEKYCGEKELFCPRDSPLNIPTSEIRFLRPPTFPHKHFINLSFSLSKPLHKKKPIFPLYSLSSSDTQMQTEVENEETEANDIMNRSKTVRVKFQLQRECSFGQQFYIVGDDPMLGQWDPAEAVSFNWSDGHVWTTELDIPIKKCIKFKIILKGPENIIWQPGPDRILQTRDTENTITVCEDWDSAELQKILEEEPIFDQIEECVIEPNKEIHIDTSSKIPDRVLVSNAKENHAAISDEDMNMLMLGGNRSMMNVHKSDVSTDGTLSTNGLPVLVPGLNPLQTTQPQDKSLKEVETNIFSDASVEAEKFKELNMPELDLKEVLDNDNQEQHKPVQVKKPHFAENEDQEHPKSVDYLPEIDSQWGLRTLQKLLANFGFR